MIETETRDSGLYERGGKQVFPDFSFLPFLVIPVIFIVVVLLTVLLKRKRKGQATLPDELVDDTTNRLFQEQMQRDMQIHQQTVQTNLQIQNDIQAMQNMQNINNQ